MSMRRDGMMCMSEGGGYLRAEGNVRSALSLFPGDRCDLSLRHILTLPTKTVKFTSKSLRELLNPG